MNDSIPDLKIEMMDDGQGDGLILLEQDSGGNIDRVAIHPIHLRYMPEKMGLLESSDPTAQKTIATLQRRMLVLYERIEHLSDWLHKLSDNGGDFCTLPTGLSPSQSTTSMVTAC